jgi:hypothetical protein
MQTGRLMQRARTALDTILCHVIGGCPATSAMCAVLDAVVALLAKEKLKTNRDPKPSRRRGTHYG